MADEESPDRLPPGWTMVVIKGRKKETYYTNLETGQRFQSKDEVLRYVKMGMLHNHSPQPVKRTASVCSGDKNMPLVVQMKDSPNWLPEGWIVQTKTRKSGRRVGEKYKCYIAPFTGRRFYSKKEVSRNLKTVKLNGYASKQKKRGIGMHSSSNVVVEKATADGLPPGWTKEVRVKKGVHKTRRDPYYTDPVSGYVFRSKKDVLRYLQTGDLGRLAIKPKKRSNNDEESRNDNISPPSAAKRLRLASIATRRRLFTGQASKLNESVEDEQILKSSLTEECVLLSKRASDQCGESTDLSGLALPEAAGSKKTQGKKDCAENRFDSAPAAEILPEKQPLVNGVEKQKNIKTQLSSSKSKDKKELILPRRASKRLAGIQADQVPDLEIGKRARRVTAKQSGDFGTSNQAHSVAVRESGELEEHPGELKTEKKDDEKAEFPFGDSWPDPCLEFAFKTLTGAIPMEDNMAIQDYFQQQLSNGLALPDVSLNNSPQTDLLVQFDAPKKPVLGPQFPAKPTFPTPEYIGLPSSSENVLQQPSGEGNKECLKKVNH